MLPVTGLLSVEQELPLQYSTLGFDEADVGSLQSRPSSSSLFADLASYLDKRLLPLHNEMRCLSNKVASFKRPRSPSPPVQCSRSASSSPSSLGRPTSHSQPIPSSNSSLLRASIVREHPAHQPEEQVDPLSITYYLPTSASLHGAGCSGKANLTFQRNMYLDLTHVSIFPPAVRASELLQVEIYGRLWSPCSITQLPESRAALQIEAAVGLLDHQPFSEDKWSLSTKPLCFSSSAAFPFVVNTIIPKFMTWLGNNPSALKEIT